MSDSIKNTHLVGCDVGTTNEVHATMDDTGRPNPIPNMEGEMMTPSCVHVARNLEEVLCGTPAKNMLPLEPERTFREFKRSVGTNRIFLKEAGVDITPLWLQAEQLKYVRESVVRFTGDAKAATKFVLTAPTRFDEMARQSLIRSVELAGGELLGIIHEPTAALLAFGLGNKQGDRLVLCVDIGGGTVDVTLMSYSGGNAEVLGSDGDTNLGGKDIDRRLLELVVEDFRSQHKLALSPDSHPGDYFNALQEVVSQKQMLSRRKKTKFVARAEGQQIVREFSRADLSCLIGDLADRIEACVNKTLETANVDRDDVNSVLLVGGSSRVAAFRNKIEDMFGKDRIVGGNVSPDLAVAEGAAIHAASIIGKKGGEIVTESNVAIPMPAINHCDVTPHCLGVIVQDMALSGTFCSALIERNSPIPSKSVKKYSSVSDDQTKFDILVVQGEDGQPASKCLVVGEKVLDLPARSREEQSIEVTMGYDASNLVLVDVHDLVSGKTADIKVDFYKKGKSE